MSTQVALTALKQQLSLKEAEVQKFKTEVHIPSVQALAGSIQEWFKLQLNVDLVEVLYDPYKITLQSYKDPSSSWRGQIGLRRNWKRGTKEEEMLLEYESATVSCSNYELISHVSKIAIIAANIQLISDKLFNDWATVYEETNTPLQQLNNEHYALSSAINKLENDLREENIHRFMRVGFECTFKPSLDIEWKDTEDGESERVLVERPHTIRLQWGRSKYDYVNIMGYKVKGKTPYKVTVEATIPKDRWNETSEPVVRTYQVTKLRFEEMVSSAYAWESTGADNHRASREKRFAEFTQKAS